MVHTIEINPEFTKTIYSGTLTNQDIKEVVKGAIGGAEFANRFEDIRKLKIIGIGFTEY